MRHTQHLSHKVHKNLQALAHSQAQYNYQISQLKHPHGSAAQFCPPLKCDQYNTNLISIVNFKRAYLKK